jgi:lipopolysaccharide export system permease protein
MIFERAALREFAKAFAALCIALLAILLSAVLIRFLGMAAGGRIPPEAVFTLIGFGALTQLPVVLTLGLFVAILMSLNRMYRDSEMVIWFSSGLSPLGFVRPVLRFAFPVALLVAACTLFVVPWAQLKSVEYREALRRQDDAARAAPGVFRESGGGQRVFFIEGLLGDAGKVGPVFVLAEKEGQIALTVAKEGEIVTHPEGARFVVLRDGRRYDGTPGQADFRELGFDAYTVRIEQTTTEPLLLRARAKPLEDLVHEGSQDSLGELVGRLGFPVAALILAFAAIPLSRAQPRTGRTRGFVLGLLIYLVYSNALSVAQAWVSQGKIPFLAGLFVPHFGVILILFLLFYPWAFSRPGRWRAAQ